MKRLSVHSNLLVIFAGLFLFESCGLFGVLRKDMDDEPAEEQMADDGMTVGGAYPELGLLDDPQTYPGPTGNERYRNVNHSERAPASVPYQSGEGNSWVKEQGVATLPHQGPTSYSETPNMVPQATDRQYRRVTREDFVNKSQNEGSLWASSGQTNYFFVENRVKSPGELVLVTVKSDLIGNVAAEIKRTLTKHERWLETQEIKEKKLAKLEGDSLSTIQAARAPAQQQGPNAAPAVSKKTTPAEDELSREEKLAEIPASYSEIDLKDKVGLAEDETMMGEVVQRYPNGNYKIRAVKRVQYRGTTRIVTMLAIAKGTDVEGKDPIPSTQLYEYRLKVYR